MPSADPRDTALPYRVDFWGSHPDEENDDCWMGTDFATLKDAEVAFKAGDLHVYDCSCKPERPTCAGKAGYNTMYIELDGPDVHRVRKNERYSRKEMRLNGELFDGAWQREIANEAGMLGGCDAYNDVMGY